MMEVVHFHRKVIKSSNYSIEGFYRNVRYELKDKFDIEYFECRYFSKGIIRRFLNTLEAAFKQKDINHITGDVNYLNLFFKKNNNIITILDCGLLSRLSGIKQTLAKIFWYTIPIARAKYVVAISQATKDEIIKYVHCNPDKIKVIHVSISPIFKRTDKTFNKLKPTILHVGTDKNKNLNRLIEAIKDLNCKLDIIGVLQKEQLKKLEENKIEYENFTYLTEDEVFARYQACDLLFFASTYEGFGMPIVEANTVGRPVITSNLLSMPEVAGDAALIVDPYNITQIKEGIKDLINNDDLRKKLIFNGYRNATRFSLADIAEQYKKLYLQLINN